MYVHGIYQISPSTYWIWPVVHTSWSVVVSCADVSVLCTYKYINACMYQVCTWYIQIHTYRNLYVPCTYKCMNSWTYVLTSWSVVVKLCRRVCTGKRLLWRSGACTELRITCVARLMGPDGKWSANWRRHRRSLCEEIPPGAAGPELQTSPQQCRRCRFGGHNRHHMLKYLGSTWDVNAGPQL